MRPIYASVSALLGMTCALSAIAAEPFNYDYLGITYDYQRIGVDGFSEELEGHRVTAIYSEELKQGLIYQAFGTTEFTDDELMNSGDSMTPDPSASNFLKVALLKKKRSEK